MVETHIFYTLSLVNIDVTGISLTDEVLFPLMKGSVQAIKVLNISKCSVTKLSSFKRLVNLEILDLREIRTLNEDVPDDIFQDLDRLKMLYASTFKFCCPQYLPLQMSPNNCIAPFDSLSTCASLLRSSVYRVLLWVFATAAVIGNVSCIMWRSVLQPGRSNTGFPVFDFVHLNA